MNNSVLKTLLNHITLVLVSPTHPGNIGGVARAMHNMGLERLALVDPKLFPHQEATARAVGADHILQGAKVYSDLISAISPCQKVYALSARQRSLPWSNLTAKEAAEQIITQIKADMKVAVVLGRESNGLTNSELAQCQYQISIPSNPDFASLNLAAAAQVIAYEIWQQILLIDSKQEDQKESRNLVTQMQLQSFFTDLEKILLQLKVLNPEHPKMLMHRLRRLFYRADLDNTELNILRGILTAINRYGLERDF